MTDLFHAYYVCKGRGILQYDPHSLERRGPRPSKLRGKAGRRLLRLRSDEAHYPDGEKAAPAPVSKLPAIERKQNAAAEDPELLRTAFRLLEQADFIRGLEEKTIERVAKAMVPLHLRKGDVLFRQGDVAVKCYGITSGSVDIFVFEQEELAMRESPRGGFPRPQVQILRRARTKEGQEDDLEADEERRLEAWQDFAASFPEKRHTWTANCDLRIRTYETNSTWGMNSQFGTHVGTQSSGSIVGERAMVNDDVRAATVVCAEDCEFLVMGRQDFDEALSDYRKQIFLTRYLPGVSEKGLFANGVPATQLFQQGRFPQGTVFLRQGVIEEDVIYVVYHGSVEFCRSTKKLSKMVAGKTVEVMQCWDVLEAGRLFGSLRVLPVSVPEVFSVRVKSAVCDILWAFGSDLGRLPKRVREDLHEQIIADATQRMRKKYARSPAGHVPPPLKRDIGIEALQEGTVLSGPPSPSIQLKSSSMSSLPAAGREQVAGSGRLLQRSSPRLAASMPCLSTTRRRTP